MADTATRPGNHTTHGQSATPLYRVWNQIKQRCHNPNHSDYSSYGGRGIFVCDAWRSSFESFVGDMGPRPTALHQVDRIDNDGPYAPWNCQWASRSEQARNRRDTRLFTFDDRSATLAEWSEVTGIKRATLAQRVYGLKWPIDKVLSTPLGGGPNR